MNSIIRFKILFSILIISVFTEAGKRRSFSVPLALISTSLNSNGSINEVFVKFEGSDEGWAVSPGNDRYVKDTRKIRYDHIYREHASQAWLLSTFEASLLSRVCESFIETLKILERDLNGSRWERCLYLDYWIPVFIKNLYFLFHAARDSETLLPTVICVSDSLFETRADSPKSDERIRRWRENPEHIIKLRITIKELIYQIEQWQQKELINPDRDMMADHSGKFIQTLELFTRLYFLIPPIENSLGLPTGK